MKQYDVNFQLTSDNKYTNRRLIRQKVNEIGDAGFAKSREKGWLPFVKIDEHVIDRLVEREFETDEFMSIVYRIVNQNENAILKQVETINENYENRAIRICCYGYGNKMIGVTLKVFPNAKSYHVSIRTCYAERNMIYRNRNVDVVKIWTRGLPVWMRCADAKDKI